MITTTTGPRRHAPRALTFLLLFCVFAFAGCQTMQGSLEALKTPFNPNPDDGPSIGGVRGPLERALKFGRDGDSDSSERRDPQAEFARYTRERQELERDLKSAQTDYDQGEFSAAQRKFKQLAKKHKGKAAGEKAQFMVAECQFQRELYPAAQDSYNLLLKNYPSTRYLDQTSTRLFEIARVWLDFPKMATSQEIAQVSFDDNSGAVVSDVVKQKRGMSWSLVPNFHDRSRPTFDAEGRAVQALRSIWLNDPSGPSAPDALMMTASYYLRKGDHRSADRYFEMLREQYPKSRHLESAFVLSSHVKLMSYQGSDYDVSPLDEAEQLRESTLRLFPNTADRRRLEGELEKIQELKAKRDWEQVRFWLDKKRNKRAAAVYCREVIRNYPNSEYATKARRVLAEIGEQYTTAPRPGDSQERPWYALPEVKAPKLPSLPTPNTFIPKTPKALKFWKSDDDTSSADGQGRTKL